MKRLEIKKFIKKNIDFVVIIISFLLIILGVYLYDTYKLKNSQEVCGKLLRKETVRMWTFFEFSYIVDGETYISTIDQIELKVTSPEKLKNMGCIKIKYAKDSPYISEIIDERIIR